MFTSKFYPFYRTVRSVVCYNVSDVVQPYFCIYLSMYYFYCRLLVQFKRHLAKFKKQKPVAEMS